MLSQNVIESSDRLRVEFPTFNSAKPDVKGTERLSMAIQRGIGYWLFALLLAQVQQATAGVLTLKNGDRLQGDLVKLEAEVVIWASDSFGHLTIAKNKIENLQTATLLKINGHSDPCTLFGVAGTELAYSCRRGGPGQVALASLEIAMPYQTFAEGAHTYRGKLGLAGTYSRGNKVEDDWDLDAEVEFRRGDFRHMMALEMEAKSQDDGPTDEKLIAEYDLDWFYKPRWFIYGDFSFGIDESKEISERYSLGSGFGFQVWELDRTALALQGGLILVKELFDRPDVTSADFESSDSRLAWELSTDYRYKLPLGSAEIFHVNSLIYSFEDSDDWRFDSDTGLNIPLGAGLFSELKVEYDLDHQPQSGTRREDSKFSVGVGYEW